MKKQNIFSYLFFNKKWVVTTAILVVFAGFFAEILPFLQGKIVALGVAEQNQITPMCHCQLMNYMI